MKISQDKPRKHHFLPRGAYLKHFEKKNDKGKIYLYDRRASEIVLTDTKNIGCERDLYVFKNAQGEPDYSIETQLLGALDSGLSALMDRLNDPKPPIQVSDEIILCQAHIVDLCCFASFQMLRTPAAIDNFKNLSLEMMKKTMKACAFDREKFKNLCKQAVMNNLEENKEPWSEDDIEKTRKMFLDEQYQLETEREYYLGVSIDMAWRAQSCFMMKEVEIWRALEDRKFITSDYPLLKMPDVKTPPLFRNGLLGSSVYFPIGSRTALFFSNPVEPRLPRKYNCIERVKIRSIPPQIVEKLNNSLIANAEHSVFASFRDKNILNRLRNEKKPERFRVTG